MTLIYSLNNKLIIFFLNFVNILTILCAYFLVQSNFKIFTRMHFNAKALKLF